MNAGRGSYSQCVGEGCSCGRPHHVHVIRRSSQMKATWRMVVLFGCFLLVSLLLYISVWRTVQKLYEM